MSDTEAHDTKATSREPRQSRAASSPVTSRQPRQSRAASSPSRTQSPPPSSAAAASSAAEEDSADTSPARPASPGAVATRSRGRRQTAVMDRVRTMNNEEKVRKEKTEHVGPRLTVSDPQLDEPDPTGAVAAKPSRPMRAKSRKTVLPDFTALPLLSTEAADILLKAMREAVDQIDNSQNNIVMLSGAEVDLLILFERFAGLIDASMRSQGAEIIDIFGDKERIDKARAIAMDVEFSPLNAKDGRIRAIKDKCDSVESYLEDYLAALDDVPAQESRLGVNRDASSAARERPFQSRKSMMIRETLARKRRELAAERNQSAKYRNITWALSWLYAHRHPKPWVVEGGEPETLPQISVQDDDGNVNVNVEELTDVETELGSEAESEAEDDDELHETYDGNPAALRPLSSLLRSRQKSADTADFGDGVDVLPSAKKKYLAVSKSQVDIASAPAENLVLLLTEEQRSRFGIAADASVWGSYMDLVCVRSTGDYKPR